MCPDAISTCGPQQTCGQFTGGGLPRPTSVCIFALILHPLSDRNDSSEQVDGVAAHWSMLCCAAMRGTAAQRGTRATPRLASATSETTLYHAVASATSETQTFKCLRQSEEKKRPQFQREFGMGADYIYIYIYVYILLIGS